MPCLYTRIKSKRNSRTQAPTNLGHPFLVPVARGLPQAWENMFVPNAYFIVGYPKKPSVTLRLSFGKVKKMSFRVNKEMQLILKLQIK